MAQEAEQVLGRRGAHLARRSARQAARAEAQRSGRHRRGVGAHRRPRLRATTRRSTPPSATSRRASAPISRSRCSPTTCPPSRTMRTRAALLSEARRAAPANGRRARRRRGVRRSRHPDEERRALGVCSDRVRGRGSVGPGRDRGRRARAAGERSERQGRAVRRRRPSYLSRAGDDASAVLAARAGDRARPQERSVRGWRWKSATAPPSASPTWPRTCCAAREKLDDKPTRASCGAAPPSFRKTS